MYAPVNCIEMVQGMFEERDHRHVFEYIKTDGLFADPEEFPHKIFVGPAAAETRYARVLKTVAYVVVDEDENGEPVVEKWNIKHVWRKG